MCLNISWFFSSAIHGEQDCFSDPYAAGITGRIIGRGDDPKGPHALVRRKIDRFDADGHFRIAAAADRLRIEVPVFTQVVDMLAAKPRGRAAQARIGQPGRPGLLVPEHHLSARHEDRAHPNASHGHGHGKECNDNDNRGTASLFFCHGIHWAILFLLVVVK